jgi:hypothetical protein
MKPMQPTELLSALCAEGVDFVLIGGLAGTIRGTTRVTRDIDIAYGTERRNLERICAVLNRYEPEAIFLGKVQAGNLTLTPELLKRSETLQLSTSLGEVDLLNRVEGFKSYGAIKALTTSYPLPGRDVQVPVLSTEGLLKAKRAMSRPKDLQDIVELEALDQMRALDDAPKSLDAPKSKGFTL